MPPLRYLHLSHQGLDATPVCQDAATSAACPVSPASRVQTCAALKALELALTQALPSAERCEHYARIY
jgi:hypothetical protein